VESAASGDLAVAHEENGAPCENVADEEDTDHHVQEVDCRRPAPEGIEGQFEGLEAVCGAGIVAEIHGGC